MKTYPILNHENRLIGFEITSTWIVFWPLLKILKSIDGITDVKRQWFNEDRISFKFHGIEAVVYEPWGDSSRYWVGLKNANDHPDIDISPIHRAFCDYKGFTSLCRSSKGKCHDL